MIKNEKMRACLKIHGKKQQGPQWMSEIMDSVKLYGYGLDM